MTIKERSPQLRYAARTHRADLDRLFERLNRDPGVFIKFVGTKEQEADILTKGSFTGETWAVLCALCLLLPINNFSKKTCAPWHLSVILEIYCFQKIHGGLSSYVSILALGCKFKSCGYHCSSRFPRAGTFSAFI